MDKLILSASLNRGASLSGNISQGKSFSATLNKGTVIVEKDYEKLINKPSINGVTLTQNKTFEDLGDHVLSNLEIMAIIKQVWK